MRIPILILTAIILNACSEDASAPVEAPKAGAESPSANQYPETPSSVSVEGRVEPGTECNIVRTPDGEVWSVRFGRPISARATISEFPVGFPMRASACKVEGLSFQIE